MFNFLRKILAHKPATILILIGEHPEFEHKSQKEGIIEPLPSQLKEVCIRYLSALEEGDLDIVQDEWIVKKRKSAATLNNRGSHHRQEVIFDLFFIFTTF
jgi:hypothetical protein